jgi:hypothetical protein
MTKREQHRESLGSEMSCLESNPPIAQTPLTDHGRHHQPTISVEFFIGKFTGFEVMAEGQLPTGIESDVSTPNLIRD